MRSLRLREQIFNMFKRLELDGVARRVEEKHGGLVARLAFEASPSGPKVGEIQNTSMVGATIDNRSAQRQQSTAIYYSRQSEHRARCADV